MTGFAQADGYRVGFGEVSGRILPAGSLDALPVSPVCEAGPADRCSGYSGFKLFGYWRSSSSWRVRVALNIKNIPFEYVAINLMPVCCIYIVGVMLLL